MQDYLTLTGAGATLLGLTVDTAWLIVGTVLVVSTGVIMLVRHRGKATDII